ncbi:COP23 domain-containing protein [Argonema galeatum]|uniref:COP23 domain-containing protein n=1 Tax=Argonema galeatum TaxID=2942762 RepID=UPI0020122463|nr:COP23 domain-containing protein [Argonema galeatum]MCL1467637.1 COP23 domain-containing protein [Argonema galeatum A003/A1]
MKSQKLLAQLLVSALAFSGVVGFVSQAQAQDDNQLDQTDELTTNFRCVREGRNYATIAERGDRATSPIVVWRTTEFGPEYTPQQRCRIVSDRLTRAVADNGGRLSNLYLTTGTVNRLPVVCYVNNGTSDCNSNNLLFTLDRRSAQNPDEVLANLLEFGTTGSGRPVYSLRPNNSTTTTTTRQRRTFSLERVVNEAFGSRNTGRPVTPRPGTGNNSGGMNGI